MKLDIPDAIQNLGHSKILNNLINKENVNLISIYNYNLINIILKLFYFNKYCSIIII